MGCVDPRVQDAYSAKMRVCSLIKHIISMIGLLDKVWFEWFAMNASIYAVTVEYVWELYLVTRHINERLLKPRSSRSSDMTVKLLKLSKKSENNPPCVSMPCKHWQ